MATFQKRGSRWRAIIRKTGHPVTQKSFSTKAMAQRWAMENERAMEQRAWSDPALMRDITLGDAIQWHRQESVEPHSTKDRALKRLHTRMGDLTLDRLKAADIVSHARNMSAEGLKPATVMAYLSPLGKVL